MDDDKVILEIQIDDKSGESAGEAFAKSGAGGGYTRKPKPSPSAGSDGIDDLLERARRRREDLADKRKKREGDKESEARRAVRAAAEHAASEFGARMAKGQRVGTAARGAARGATAAIGTAARGAARGAIRTAATAIGTATATTAGLAGLVTLGITAGATAAGFVALKVATKALEAGMVNAAKAAKFNPLVLASSQLAARQEVAGDIRRSQRLGPELSRTVLTNSAFKESLADFRVELLKAILPAANGVVEFFTKLVDIATAILETANNVWEFLQRLPEALLKAFGLDEATAKAITDKLFGWLKAEETKRNEELKELTQGIADFLDPDKTRAALGM